MANPQFTTNTNAGTFSGKYIAAALLSASTLDKGLITIMPNVKYKSVIQTASYDNIVKNSTCDFDTSGGTLTLDEKVITPEEFQVNVQLCKKDLHASWEAEQMGYSAFDNLAPNFEEFVLAHTAAKVADKIETTIWEGTDATAGEFAGFSDLLDADATVVDVTGTTVDSSNVITEMGKIVDAIPSTVYGKEDLFIYASPSFARAYIRALGGFGAQGLGANGVNNQGTTWFTNGALSFDGIPVVVAQGLGANKAVAAQKSNLFFGTGLLSDMVEAKVIDMQELDGSRNVRVIMRYTAAVQTGIGSDIVWYRA